MYRLFYDQFNTILTPDNVIFVKIAAPSIAYDSAREMQNNKVQRGRISGLIKYLIE